LHPGVWPVPAISILLSGRVAVTLEHTGTAAIRNRILRDAARAQSTVAKKPVSVLGESSIERMARAEAGIRESKNIELYN
jgi:hypothetical protein